MKMFGRVFVFRGIAAAHVTARQAQPQMDPRIARFQALFAAAGVGLHVVDLIQMMARLHGLAP
jgi:hypothetical protein